MLTQEQITNIHKLDSGTCMQILHECAERLGVVNVSAYCGIMGCKKRTAYQRIKDGKLNVFILGEHIFPCINF